MEEQKKYKSILMNPEITLEYIYTGDLSFDSIKDNPILKPISEINKSYCDLHLTATKAILEYEDEYKKIQELETINPRYTNTVLMATIKNMINIMKTIVYSQDLQIISMKNAINEQISISDSKYKLIDDERERIEKIRKDVRKEIEKEYEINSQQTKPNKIIDGKESLDSNSVSHDSGSNLPLGTNSAGTREGEDEFDKTFSDLKRIAGGEELDKKR